MSTIELDDQTAKEIRDAAQVEGMSVAAFVRMRVLGMRGLEKGVVKKDKQADDVDAEIDGLLFSGPTLPADFSRADIYTDE